MWETVQRLGSLPRVTRALWLERKPTPATKWCSNMNGNCNRDIETLGAEEQGESCAIKEQLN